MEMFSASSNVKKRTRENNIIQQGEMKLLAVAFVFVLVAEIRTSHFSPMPRLSPQAYGHNGPRHGGYRSPVERFCRRRQS
ncbi:uncharacterized protein LOC144098892 isoform X2 [Amblyomma americanum]